MLFKYFYGNDTREDEFTTPVDKDIPVDSGIQIKAD